MRTLGKRPGNPLGHHVAGLRKALIDAVSKEVLAHPAGTDAVRSREALHLCLIKAAAGQELSQHRMNGQSDQVAAAITELIDMSGERPLRTVVGVDYRVRELNRVAAPFQAGLLKGLGMSHLA